MVPINSTIIGKTSTKFNHGPRKLQNAINKIQSMVIFTVQKEYHQTSKILLIKEKFIKADYPLCFINCVVNEIQKGKTCRNDGFIIPTSLFETAKPFIFVEIPYCELHEIKLKYFLNKLLKITNNSFRMVITWKTMNV